jgi:hypothetical protein
MSDIDLPERFVPRTAGGGPMTVPLLLGLACGAGLWLAVAHSAAPVPLAQALADLHRPATGSGRAGGRRHPAALGLLLGRSGLRTPARSSSSPWPASPRSLGRGTSCSARRGLTVPLAVWAALAAIGHPVPRRGRAAGGGRVGWPAGGCPT